MQLSLDELGIPLRDVTFCVIDIETTGSDRGGDTITEVGAVKVRGGQVLGTMSTLVNPGRAISPKIVLLTGITDSMVASAPRIETVLPTLQEFVADSVIVGHNAGFDVGFINTALRRSNRQPFTNTVVDTLALARRLVRDEVPDCRLGTLASRFRLNHRPNHRALDDALATTDLLHLMLERAAGMGVMGLDDLVALPSMGGHPQAAKLKLTHHLPRAPGVYRFLDAHGEVLYVGKATNLRQRVRSYFSTDSRRKIGALIRETHELAHTVTPDALTAEVLELRYLHHLQPRYNRVGTNWQKYCYVRLTADEAWPRLVITNEPSATGLHLGPLTSRSAAAGVIEAVQSALPIRRCNTRIGRNYKAAPGSVPCRGAQLGVAMCPCAGTADEVAYAGVVARVVAALTTSPEVVLEPLWRRVEALALAQRYEEAASARDRARTFADAVSRQRLFDQLRSAGDIGVRLHDTVLHLNGGVLSTFHTDGQLPTELELPPPSLPELPAPLPRHAADEVLCLARALERASFRSRLLWCSGEWTLPTNPVREVTRLAIAA
jgi:DNA polymerase-3 subunit epsilon